MIYVFGFFIGMATIVAVAATISIIGYLTTLGLHELDWWKVIDFDDEIYDPDAKMALKLFILFVRGIITLLCILLIIVIGSFIQQIL